MRLLIFWLVVLSGCGARLPTPDAGDQLDSGFFDDGGCVPYTCAGLGRNCGNIGDGCGGLAGGPSGCGTCSSPLTCGGGGNYNICGSPDAGNGPIVFVTLKWDFVRKGAGCPPTWTVVSCAGTIATTKPKLDTMRLIHGTCSTSQIAADGYAIDCSGKCTVMSANYQCATNGPFYTSTSCTSMGGGCAGVGDTAVCSRPRGDSCVWDAG